MHYKSNQKSNKNTRKKMVKYIAKIINQTKQKNFYYNKKILYIKLLFSFKNKI